MQSETYEDNKQFDKYMYTGGSEKKWDFFVDDRTWPVSGATGCPKMIGNLENVLYTTTSVHSSFLEKSIKIKRKKR